MVDTEIKKFLTQKETNDNKKDKNSITVYYESQMHLNYKIEERVIKNIIYDNTKCTSPNDKLDLIFYYKNKKTSQLIMKNNLNPPPTLLEQTNVVYEFTCPMSHSQVTKYIGLTQTTLSHSLRETLQVLYALGIFKTYAGNQKRHMTGTGLAYVAITDGALFFFTLTARMEVVGGRRKQCHHVLIVFEQPCKYSMHLELSKRRWEIKKVI